MAKGSLKSRLLDAALILAVAYLLTTVVTNWFFPKQDATPVASGVLLKMQDASLREGANPMLVIENHRTEPVPFAARCPEPPVDVYYRGADGAQEPVRVKEGEPVSCPSIESLAPDATATIDLGPWKYSHFSQRGRYELRLPEAPGEPANAEASVTFTIHEPGVFVKLFRAFISKPFLNFLIFVAAVTPGHNLGL